MAEIGIIASVIGVAGAGFRLSLILNAVGSEVASAGIEIHSISKGVTLFSLMLKQVGQHLQAHDSVHTHEALDTAKQVTEECQHVFDEISEMLDRVQSKKTNGASTMSIQQRFKWCFKKHRVTYLLAQLESLKMSLLIMLQILQLGKLMASPPKSDAKEDIAIKEDVISTERAETQNIIIVRYWAMSRIDRLYHAAEQEDLEDRRAEIEEKNQNLMANGQPQLAIEPPPDSPTSTALMRLPVVSLGELDAALHGIKDSPRDMIRISDAVIDPLLDRWTRWHELREQHENHRPESRDSAPPPPKYTPSVDDLYEDPSDYHPSRAYPHEPDSPEHGREPGYFLEGTTTDWRQPHSAEARREARRLRRQYANYQASVEASADDEIVDQRGAKPPAMARPPSRHVIDSSSSSVSSSDSEVERQKQRRSRRSSASLSEKSHNSGRRRPYSRESSGLTKFPSSPTNGASPRASIGNPYSPNPQRPHFVHSASTPLPPLHTGNVPNPYQPPPPGAITNPYAPPHGGGQYIPPRYVPSSSTRLPPIRPPSSDGKQRSPSRISAMTPHHTMEEDERRQARQRRQQNLRKGATRGLLGAGAIAGFLEALEGLSI